MGWTILDKSESLCAAVLWNGVSRRISPVRPRPSSTEASALDRAGLLWGAIESEQAFAPLGGWQRHRDACEAQIRSHATPEFDRAVDEGRKLDLDDAVELALAPID